MLTFQEALTALKLGKAVRFGAWPAGQFVRLGAGRTRLYVPDGRGRPVAGPDFLPSSQAELLGANWSIA